MDGGKGVLSLIGKFPFDLQRDLLNEQFRGRLGKRQCRGLQRYSRDDEGTARAMPQKSGRDGGRDQRSANGDIRVSASIHVAQVELFILDA